MRWIALAVIFLAIPIFAALIGRDRQRRDLAVMALGGLVFFVGYNTAEASIYTWPTWQGIAKGMVVSLADSLAIALLLTRPPGRYKTYFLPVFTLYFLTLALSLVSSVNWIPTTFVVFQFAQIMVFFVAIAGELQRSSALRNLLKGIALGLLLQAAYVIRQKLGGVVQATGTLGHQNIMGMMVILGIMPLIAAVLEGERNKLFYAGIIGGAICIAGSGSRGTMGFFAISIVLLVFLSLMRRATARKWKMLGLGVLASAMIIPLAVETLRDRFGTSSLITEESARATLAKAAQLIAADHPWGVGANNFVVVNNVGGYLNRAGGMLTELTNAQPAHNAYLVARAETGWVGEIAMIALLTTLILSGLVTAFRYRRQPVAGIALGSGIGLFAIAMQSNFEYAWHILEVQRIFVINAAIIVGCLVLAKQTTGKSAKTTRRPNLAAKEALVSGRRPSPLVRSKSDLG